MRKEKGAAQTTQEAPREAAGAGEDEKEVLQSPPAPTEPSAAAAIIPGCYGTHEGTPG